MQASARPVEERVQPPARRVDRCMLQKSAGRVSGGGPRVCADFLLCCGLDNWIHGIETRSCFKRRDVKPNEQIGGAQRPVENSTRAQARGSGAFLGPLQEPQVPEERGESWLWPIRGRLQASGQFCYTWQQRPTMGRPCQTSDTDLLSFLQRKSTELYFETTSTRLSRSRFQRHFERRRCGNVDRSNGANEYLQVSRASRKLRLFRSRHLVIPSCLSLCLCR
jgi:hypothetical protein